MQSDFSPMRRLAAVLLGVALLGVVAAPAALAAPQRGAGDAAVQKAAHWILGHQQPDGSFPGFGVGSTADAILALAAAGQPANPRASSGMSALDYLAGQAA